jgi:hypothetical protein
MARNAVDLCLESAPPTSANDCEKGPDRWSFRTTEFVSDQASQQWALSLVSLAEPTGEDDEPPRIQLRLRDRAQKAIVPEISREEPVQRGCDHRLPDPAARARNQGVTQQEHRTDHVCGGVAARRSSPVDCNRATGRQADVVRMEVAVAERQPIGEVAEPTQHPLPASGWKKLGACLDQLPEGVPLGRETRAVHLVDFDVQACETGRLAVELPRSLHKSVLHRASVDLLEDQPDASVYDGLRDQAGSADRRSREPMRGPRFRGREALEPRAEELEDRAVRLHVDLSRATRPDTKADTPSAFVHGKRFAPPFMGRASGLVGPEANGLLQDRRYQECRANKVPGAR